MDVEDLSKEERSRSGRVETSGEGLYEIPDRTEEKYHIQFDRSIEKYMDILHDLLSDSVKS